MKILGIGEKHTLNAVGLRVAKSLFSACWLSDFTFVWSGTLWHILFHPSGQCAKTSVAVCMIRLLLGVCCGALERSSSF